LASRDRTGLLSKQLWKSKKLPASLVPNHAYIMKVIEGSYSKLLQEIRNIDVNLPKKLHKY